MDWQRYTNIPFQRHGHDRLGCDCRGLALLYLHEQHGLPLTPLPHLTSKPQPEADAALEAAIQGWGERPREPRRSLAEAGEPQAGDIVFFRDIPTQLIRHVAIYCGDNRYLHTLRGSISHIVPGLEIFRRFRLAPAGHLPPDRVADLLRALANPALADPISIIVGAIILGTAAAVGSALLMPKPKVGAYRNESGRYGFDNLITRSDTTLPIPDILGSVILAGNVVHQSLLDRSQSTGDGTTQKANRVVILASGPVHEYDYADNVIQLNGLPLDSDQFYSTGGFEVDPTQDAANAVDNARPTVTRYTGAHAIEVPTDIRASYDRGFPVHGHPGCAYLVFRLVDTTKFQGFNLLANIKGRKCRTYTASGWDVTSVSGESLTGADGTKTRFKLAFEDVKTVDSVTVNGTAYTAADQDNQSGDVFTLNATKGYLEFHTAPAASATITVDYDYHPREWTQNNANHAVYLLTEPIRGKGLPESKINWTRAAAFRDYCDEMVFTPTDAGQIVETRHTSNYAIDANRPLQDHLRAVLDAAYAYIFASDGKIVLKPRRDDTVVMAFDDTNILVQAQGDQRVSTLTSERLDRTQIANRVRVRYRDRHGYNTEAEILQDDPADQDARAARAGNDGITEETLDFLAVDRQTHAERLAATILAENQTGKNMVKYKTTIKGLPLEPGDIITIDAAQRPSLADLLFRVEGLTHDPDDHLEITALEYASSNYL